MVVAAGLVLAKVIAAESSVTVLTLRVCGPVAPELEEEDDELLDELELLLEEVELEDEELELEEDELLLLLLDEPLEDDDELEEELLEDELEALIV